MRKIPIAINSLAYYLISYFFVFLFFQSATILAAKLFDFSVKFNYTRIDFLVARYEWDFDSVKLIYSAGPVVTILLAIFMIVVAVRFREYVGKLKMFFLWGFVHSISIILGSTYAGTLLGEGFGHVVSWMFIPDTGKLIITLASLFLLAASGFAITRLFLLSGNSYFNLLKTDDIPAFLLYQLIIPFIVGSALIVLLRLPMNFYEAIRIITPIVVVLPVWLNGRQANDMFFDESPKKAVVSRILMIGSIAFIALYRIILQFPIQL